MAAKSRTNDRDGATDIELYLPAGGIPPADTGRLGSLWDDLFNHTVEPPK
jgi:hypothetical protein